MTTTDTPADLQALVTEVTARVITSVGYEPREEHHVIAEEVSATLKQLGYGRCAVCRHPGGPDTLEVINRAPSFACRGQKACLRRQHEAELSRQLTRTRELVGKRYIMIGDGQGDEFARRLADNFKLVDHLLARLGVAGAELHPELED